MATGLTVGLALAAATAISPAAAAPDASGATTGTSTLNASVEWNSVEHGYPGYVSDLTVVEDELSASANHLTVRADFCVHPEAAVGEGVGFDIMWDAPISDWEVLTGLDERYTSSVPVLDGAGNTVLTADLAFGTTELPGGWGIELKTSVDLRLTGPGGAGSCGTLELPIAAPLALADVSESQPDEPQPDGPQPDEPSDDISGEGYDDYEEYDPYAYVVSFVDQEGRRSSDSVSLNPTELPAREAWVSGELDFTGSTHWVMLTEAGPAPLMGTTVVLHDGDLCREPYEALIIDSDTLYPTNQEPDLDVSCDAGTKTFTLENRLRADRQLVISQFDPQPGARAVTHELTVDLTTDGVTERRTASVTSAAPVGRLTEAWTAPPACPAPFTDAVPAAPGQPSDPTSRYQHEIRWMQCWSITQGYADGTYRADRNISRGETVAFLHRYNQQVGPAFPLLAPGERDEWGDELEETPFWDIDPDHTFAEPIAWAVWQGLTHGYADGSFRAERPVTRGELAALSYRLVDGGYSAWEEDPDDDSGGTADEPGRFSDVPEHHGFAVEIAWLADNGIITGYADGTFRPERPISRGEVARVLSQVHERLVQRSPVTAP